MMGNRDKVELVVSVADDGFIQIWVWKHSLFRDFILNPQEQKQCLSFASLTYHVQRLPSALLLHDHATEALKIDSGCRTERKYM